MARPVERSLPVESLGELGTSAAAVPAGSEVILSAMAEASGADVVLTGTLAFAWEGECRRCLQPVTGRVETDVREIFQAHPVEGETWPLEGDAVDLGPVLSEAVLLALPLVPLCSEDCAGPDPERFPARVEDVDGGPGPEGGTGPEVGADAGEGDEGGERDGGAPGRPVDPRWAALDALRFD